MDAPVPAAGAVDHALARRIDHTLLAANATAADVARLCDEALRFGFASVCVSSANVARAAARVAGSAVRVCAVVGFPLGTMAPRAKAFEAQVAVADGATEIDMVLHRGALKGGDHQAVLDDVAGVVAAARPAAVKVILETGALTDDEKAVAVGLCRRAGAAFVKTSTGFGPGGATEADVALLHRLAGPDLEVKAAGGIRTRADALRMVAAGASRIGASASVAIVTAAPEAAHAPPAGGY